MIHCFRRIVTNSKGFRFCSNIQQKGSNELPIHLRNYDAKKYEVPSSKIKLTTGYSFLDVEPMPRSKIMKICYTVLDKLKKEIDEGVLYRTYTEEKMKYIMRLTDEIEDIRTLEHEFGNICIEQFIQSLYMEIELVDQMKALKPWEITCDDDSVEQLRQPHPSLKHERVERPGREQTKFIQ